MKKVVIIFGLISGAIVMFFSFVIAGLCERNQIDFDNAQYVGYAAMIVSLSMIFFGIKSYRDNYANGQISFVRGLQVGFLILAVATVIYFAGGEIYNVVNPGFNDRVMDKYVEYRIGKMSAAGASAQELDVVRTQISDAKVALRNPLTRFAGSLIELPPVGIIIALGSAAILRRKKARLAQQPAH